MGAEAHAPGEWEPPAWWGALLRERGGALHGLRVGVYGSGGAPYHHAALVALWGGVPVTVRGEDVRAGALDDLDALVFPGGGRAAMAGMLAPLGVDGAEAVRRWVAAGGMYLGSCAGSFLPAAVGEAYWSDHEEARRLHMVRAPLANGGDSALGGLVSPGVGTLEVAASDRGHWLADGLPDRFALVHYNGPLFDLGAPDAPTARAGEAPLAPPVGVLRPLAATAAFTPGERFLDADGAPDGAPDGGPDGGPAEATLFDRCAAGGAHNGLVGAYGDGLVVLFGSHPEFGFSALQLGWGPGVRLLANALAHQAARRGARPAPGGGPPAADRILRDAEEALLRASLIEGAASLERAADGFLALHDADADAWLAGSPSFLGRTPAALWREATAEGARAAASAAALARSLAGAADADLRAAAPLIDDEPRPDQDVGAMGFEQLAASVRVGVEAAATRLAEAPVPLAHAYDGLDSHPYHLAAGSYLSAAGLAAAALLCASSAATLAGRADLAPLGALLLPADPLAAAQAEGTP